MSTQYEFMKRQVVEEVAALQEKLIAIQADCINRIKEIPVTSDLNCTPFVRQYDILSKKWGVLLCQKEYQTNDIRRSSREWL